MGLYILRIMMFFVFASAGAAVALMQWGETSGLMGAGIGVLAGLLVWAVEYYLRSIPLQSYFYGLAGLLVGLLVGAFGSFLVRQFPMPSPAVAQVLSLLPYAICIYFGVVLGLAKGPEFGRREDSEVLLEGEWPSSLKILDTSVIIDGRIADICETGFLEGALLVPQFILKELQQIAGSSDALKRNRGSVPAPHGEWCRAGGGGRCRSDRG